MESVKRALGAALVGGVCGALFAVVAWILTHVLSQAMRWGELLCMGSTLPAIGVFLFGTLYGDHKLVAESQGEAAKGCLVLLTLLAGVPIGATIGYYSSQWSLWVAAGATYGAISAVVLLLFAGGWRR